MVYSWDTSYNVVLPFVNLSSFSSEDPLVPAPTPAASIASCVPIDRFVSPEDLQQLTQAQLGNISAELGFPICPYTTTTSTPIPTFPTTQQPMNVYREVEGYSRTSLTTLITQAFLATSLRWIS